MNSKNNCWRRREWKEGETVLNDFPELNRVLQQMGKQRDGEVEGRVDKTPENGVQRVREARGISPPNRDRLA